MAGVRLQYLQGDDENTVQTQDPRNQQELMNEWTNRGINKRLMSRSEQARDSSTRLVGVCS